MNIFTWLFERCPSDWKPQMCWAGANKSALLWLPGNTFKGSDFVRWAVGKATFVGCTQLAFRAYTVPQTQQQVLVGFVALDIDELPIDDSKLIEVCQQFSGSLRASCGGSGRHMLFRLAKPVACSYQQANAVVKLLTAPIVAAVEQAGMVVCKADKRAFYLEGGKNAWMHHTEDFYENKEALNIDTATEQWVQSKVVAYTQPVGQHTAGVEHWLRQFRAAGLISVVGSRNPVHINRFVRLLRLAGESVHTRSPLSSTGGVNGYLDVGVDWISLWAWADGCSIWRWGDE